MAKQDGRDAFVRGAEEAFDELQTWCQAHPAFTLLELEEQALAIRQRLIGQALSSLVAQRAAGAAARKRWWSWPAAASKRLRRPTPRRASPCRRRSRIGPIGSVRGRRSRRRIICVSRSMARR